ncbi:MAG: hypothetical protein JXB50_09685 [Spirochaetes bacterium]|nr:hypothetical protein [Spirochaetota bacterium]
MRVGIIYYADKNSKFIDLIKSIEKAITERGFQTQIINVKESKSSISMFNFIIIGCNNISMFGGKIPDQLKNTIKKSSGISGKHCFAFVDKKFGSFKTLSNLMKILEHEGVIIFSSEVLMTKDHAYRTAKEIIIE